MMSSLRCGLSLAAFGSSATALSDGMSLVQVSRDVPQPAFGLISSNRSASRVEMSETIDELAAKVPQGPTKDFLSRLKVCGACKEFQRFGEELKDGGYLVCMDGMQGNTRAAYSMGVEHHDKFSIYVNTVLKVPVHQLDCTVDRPPLQHLPTGKHRDCDDCHFYKVCLKGDKAWRSPNGTVNGIPSDWEGKVGGHPIGPNMNMQEVLNMTGQADAPNNSLFMKMDIEGSEWPIFANGFRGLEKFNQLIFEFHHLQLVKNHATYASALKTIMDHGFKVVHIHGNNNKAFYGTHIGDNYYQVPIMLEVTFAKNVPDLEACEARQKLHPLDQNNNQRLYPLPLAKLPE
jgi:hypothetical protein